MGSRSRCHGAALSGQLREFIPLPMTRACVQYVTGKDPLTLQDLHVPRGERERRMQKALVRWKAPESRRLVEEALVLADRKDLLDRFHRAIRAGRTHEEHANLELDTCG